MSAKSARALLDFLGDNGEGIHLRGGHVGAVVSSKACDRLWPQIENWFISHDGEAPPLRATA